MSNYHRPVMLEEVLEYFQPTVGKKFVDCTLGDGGHTIELLKNGSQVLGIDYSGESLDRANTRISETENFDNFIGVNGNFKDLERIAEENDFTQVNGVLFDLGYSSYQLENGQLGLSFQKDEFLDMRLDKSLGVPAADLINGLGEREIQRVLSEYGGERFAKKIAKAIVENRRLKKLQTTKELSDLIVNVTPSGYEKGRIHPATRTFQALRIAVNDELSNLEQSLPRAARLLLPGGRMIVISFHSLEDKLAKNFGSNVQPKVTELTKKPLSPSLGEVKRNDRARSAKMRVYERL